MFNIYASLMEVGGEGSPERMGIAYQASAIA
jgi:hypothetical protein